ncbi:hypothetical protein BT96DRAFT_1006454 [Gymnopus androsaceus JB14]|uniref:CxC2-like cysteine cluster KDZ transposase-associated domain-containing protein n=1 Tax=Gymnopus androsaceus JB14 TaxID=1447944 RepID=A0A6A4GLA6_9AGAR|nr:hypothetical protein BT96DRAFT_1006454 [Gymnopus androsaceus JB14]
MSSGGSDASDPDSSPIHNTTSSIPPINSTRQSTFCTDFLAARTRVKELVPLAKKKNPVLTKLIMEHFNAKREALERLPMETMSDAHVDEHNARWHYAILQQTISKLIPVVDIIWENWFEDYYMIFGDRFCVEEMTSHCPMISIINTVPDEDNGQITGPIFPVTAKLLMMKQADVHIGTPCACANAICEVRCLDCMQFLPLCWSCWVDAHKHHPFHWAEVWSHEQGYFIRQDISILLDSDYGIPLGHDGEHCPKASKAILMTVVDLNSVHTTKITTCQCGDNGRWRQLFNADLFPATIMTLQSKITAYHYIRALCHLTDNVFTGNVPDPYKQYMFVTHIWPLLEAKKRFGRLHGDGMNELFPRHPKGNLMLYCPACPELDVNMESGWERTLSHLCHLHSLKRTVDKNFKTRNYNKKNDTNDVSLFGGRAYMASEQRYQHYLETVLQLQKEKMTCTHLNVANRVNRAKFKNQQITGNINVQCEHIFVRSSVDMTYGERHALVDLAMELHLEAAIFDKGHEPNCIWSYDNMCGLTPNISQCFSTSDPKIAGGLLFEHGNVGEDEDEDDKGGDTSEDPIFSINDLKYLGTRMTLREAQPQKAVLKVNTPDPNKTRTEQQSKNPDVPLEG